MSVPGIVQSALEGEEIVTRVSLGGEDEFFVTPTDSLIYRSDGLLSDESVDQFPHDADRLTISEGRRKTRFSLEYPLEGVREFTVPASATAEVVNPLVAGVLAGNDVTDPGEKVIETYRFSELTLIITSNRLVKHIGEAVWDGEFEQYHFDDVTNLSFEDGSVATQIVLVVDGRPERIKAPNEQVDNVRQRLESALFAYHGVDSLAEFNEVAGEEESETASTDPAEAFGDGVDPLGANPPEPDGDDTAQANATGESTTKAQHEAKTERTQAQDGTFEGDGSDDGVESTAVDSSSTEGEADGTRTTAGIEDTPTETNAEPVVESASVSSETEATDPLAGPDKSVEGETQTDDPHERETGDGKPSGGGASGFEESGFEAATTRTDPELLERLDSLERTVTRQTTLLEQQQRTIEQLIEELRRGR